VIYVAAALIVAGVALFVAAPLGGGLVMRWRAANETPEAERLRHERELAIQGLRELDFDRELGKLAEPDYVSLREALMARALGASAAMERLRGAAPAVAAREQAAHARPRLVKPVPAAPGPRIRFCPQCGARPVPGNFCCECGAPLGEAVRATSRAER
jgi:hypothetical protein